MAHLELLTHEDCVDDDDCVDEDSEDGVSERVNDINGDDHIAGDPASWTLSKWHKFYQKKKRKQAGEEIVIDASTKFLDDDDDDDEEESAKASGDSDLPPSPTPIVWRIHEFDRPLRPATLKSLFRDKLIWSPNLYR